MSKKAFCFFKAIKKKITYIRSIIIPSTKVDSIKLKIMNIINKTILSAVIVPVQDGRF